MPIVTVEWVEGRTKEQQDKLAQAITENVINIANAKPESVTVIIKDNPAANIYKAGTPLSQKK